jgi:prophage antirepressor-like protein
MSDIVPFSFDGNQVRVLVDLEGNPWWVAADACKVLGYANPRSAVNQHVRDHQKGVQDIDTLGGRQQALIINEGGLYRLIMRNSKPDAERFQDWVTDEVLPSIRRAGGYSTAPAIPQSFAEALELAAAQQREIEAAQAQLAIAAPKAEFHDRFMESGGLSSMTDLADMFGTSVGKFTGWLADLGVFRKGEYAQFPGRRMPRKHYLDKGMFEVKIECSPQGIRHPVAYATPSGLEFVQKILRENVLAD